MRNCRIELAARCWKASISWMLMIQVCAWRSVVTCRVSGNSSVLWETEAAHEIVGNWERLCWREGNVLWNEGNASCGQTDAEQLAMFVSEDAAVLLKAWLWSSLLATVLNFKCAFRRLNVAPQPPRSVGQPAAGRTPDSLLRLRQNNAGKDFLSFSWSPRVPEKRGDTKKWVLGLPLVPRCHSSHHSSSSSSSAPPVATLN